MTEDRLPDVSRDEASLRNRVVEALDQATGAGATDAEASLVVGAGLEVGVRGGAIETLAFNQDQGFSITVHVGQQQGSASSSDTSDPAIRNTIRAALNIARFTQEDEYLGLAEADQLATEQPDLQLYDPWFLGIDEATSLALECEAAALAADPSIVQVESASVSTVRSCGVYGNTRGFTGSSSSTRHSIGCLAIAEGKEGKRQDYWYDLRRSPKQLRPAGEVGAEAGQRAAARLGVRRLQGGKMPVLFAPTVSGGLLGHLLSAISGAALYNKASFLLDKLGEQVMSEHLTICENPYLPGGLGSSAFDGDGVATRRQALVRQGRLETYLLGVYAARRLGRSPTGNAGGVHNLFVQGHRLARDALLTSMGRGLLVTSMMGQGVNLVNGDFSRGASGFLVEDGRIQYPVEEVTIAANLQDMFRRIPAIGDDPQQNRNLQVPSLLVEEMTVAA